MFTRQVGFSFVAALAIAVTFGLQPEEPEPISTTRFDRQVQQAFADFDANVSRTAGSPDRQVVNDWAYWDLLTISPDSPASMESPGLGPGSEDRLPAPPPGADGRRVPSNHPAR